MNPYSCHITVNANICNKISGQDNAFSRAISGQWLNVMNGMTAGSCEHFFHTKTLWLRVKNFRTLSLSPSRGKPL